MKLVKESIVVLVSVGLVAAIVYTPLADYSAQILAGLIIFSLLFIIIKKRRKKEAELFVGSYHEVAAIIIGVLLIIFVTQGINSGLFFLLYFLLFGITFMFEPPIVFVFLIAVCGVFLPEALRTDIFSNLVRLGSIVMLSPIAFFFGNEFKKREKLESEIVKKTDEIIKETEELFEEEVPNASEKEVNRMNEIVKKSKELKNLTRR